MICVVITALFAGIVICIHRKAGEHPMQVVQVVRLHRNHIVLQCFSRVI